MDNTTQQTNQTLPNDEKVTYVTLRKSEVIEILKALEGLKHKLQLLLK